MNKPIEPQKVVVEEVRYDCNYQSLKSIIDGLPDGIDLNEVTIEADKEFSYYDDCTSNPVVCYKTTITKTDKQFNKEMAKYKRDLKAYNEFIDTKKSREIAELVKQQKATVKVLKRLDERLAAAKVKAETETENV